MNRIFSVTAIAALLITGTAIAQTPAVNAPASPAPSAMAPAPAVPAAATPAPAKNRFTEGQVRKYLEANGFSKIESLILGPDSYWRGTGDNKSGKTVNVAVAPDGKITEN
jgi:hypothetical protein